MTAEMWAQDRVAASPPGDLKCVLSSLDSRIIVITITMETSLNVKTECSGQDK